MKTSVMSGSCLASLELVLVLHFKQALPFLKKHGVTFDRHVKMYIRMM